MPQNHILRSMFSGTAVVWSSKVSRLQKLCQLQKSREDGKELQGDQIELTKAIVLLKHRKYMHRGKILRFLIFFKLF